MHKLATIVVPSIKVHSLWQRMFESVLAQCTADVQLILVDNSGQGLIADLPKAREAGAVIRAPRNLGFGPAINVAFQRHPAKYLITLNDDAIPEPGWLAALLDFAESHPDAGMLACKILLGNSERLDSAGLGIYGDGTGKQRGHGRAASSFVEAEEVLCPSGCAALYSARLFEDVGFFDERYFLYHEDMDLGLRARMAGWCCQFVPGAVVRHWSSASAGKGSKLKAYLVERNRIFTVWKVFPARLLARVPFYTAIRYGWHAIAAFKGEGEAASFSRSSQMGWIELAWTAFKAHLAFAKHYGWLQKERERFKKVRRLSSEECEDLIRRHWISAREIALQ